jgi:hypothetical protein
MHNLAMPLALFQLGKHNQRSMLLPQICICYMYLTNTPDCHESSEPTIRALCEPPRLTMSREGDPSTSAHTRALDFFFPANSLNGFPRPIVFVVCRVMGYTMIHVPGEGLAFVSSGDMTHYAKSAGGTSAACSKPPGQLLIILPYLHHHPSKIFVKGAGPVVYGTMRANKQFGIMQFRISKANDPTS